MQKKILAILSGAILVALVLAGCAANNSNSQTESSQTGVINPWTEFSSAQDMCDATGLLVHYPANANDLVLSAIVDEGLVQASYALDGLDVTVRMQKTESLEDISGMYYTWENNITFRNSYGNDVTFEWNDGEAAVFLDYNVSEGTTYSCGITGDTLSEDNARGIYEQQVESASDL